MLINPCAETKIRELYHIRQLAVAIRRIDFWQGKEEHITWIDVTVHDSFEVYAMDRSCQCENQLCANLWREVFLLSGLPI